MNAAWLILGAVAAAPPPAPPEPDAWADASPDETARELADWLVDLSAELSQDYVRPMPAIHFLRAGLDGVYRAAGEPLPDRYRKQLTDPEADAASVVRAAYRALGPNDTVAGRKAILAAADGITAATDPYTGLMASRPGGFATSDAEFGVGFELDGATGRPWLLYHARLSGPRGARNGGYPPPPAEFPWRVRRVIPGGPAAEAGVRPGDLLTHLDGQAVTPRSAARLFHRLATVEGAVAARPVRWTFARPGAEPFGVYLDRDEYAPEAVAGVARRPDGTWDHLLDKPAGIGYVRVGAVEDGSDDIFRAAVAGLLARRANGLVLDLRWCPGGYVDASAGIATLLLPERMPAVRLDYRDKSHRPREYMAGSAAGRAGFVGLPLVVLVGPETTGAGELIAAALGDNGRGRVVGQRTFGKGVIMSLIGTRLRGLPFRTTTGYALGPTGRNRHRFPGAGPGDDWGVRPDLGCEVPVTPDVSAQLREAAERQAARPARDRTAVAFDDPLTDPQKLVAVRLLKEELRKGK